uniref:ATP synthase FO subunit 8 n=1 Tax=Polistes jokahamae TaxID=256662 RepID=A0A0F7H1L0_POLJO|nr:ATP synthase F0 subunit 8 [Polistes hebraeus]AKG64598.1 ATP synthase FO subunit 8 [Polistes jokahamae]UMB50749.1 ATP synthase F0 subunit 8 [Polistes hebraeus]
MPQISPLKWLTLYFITLLIFLLIMIQFNYLMNFNKKRLLNHKFNNNLTWKL